MPTPQDVAFGRLAVARGLVTTDAVRSLYQRLPPGVTLAGALVQARALSPQAAQALSQELARLGPAAFRPPSSGSGTWSAMGPPPSRASGLGPPPSDEATLHVVHRQFLLSVEKRLGADQHARCADAALGSVVL